MIQIEDYKKIEIRVGKIEAAEKIAGADKLLLLKVNFGTETRQIVSGIAPYFPKPEVLVGKLAGFVTNLEPRLIRGYESHGMILAAKDGDENFSLLEINTGVVPGTLVS